MPIIEIHMVEGRSSEKKQRLASAVTEAVCESLACSQEAVRILITEHSMDEHYVGGLTKTQREALQEHGQ